MDSSKSLTANFLECPFPVRIAGTVPQYYPSLQEAYDAAFDGAVLQIRNVVFADNLDASRNISVILEGGYNCTYTAITGLTTFNGIMTVSDGAVTIGDFIFGN